MKKNIKKPAVDNRKDKKVQVLAAAELLKVVGGLVACDAGSAA